MMERVLVTGAAGFLGWNLVDVLLTHDFFVEAVVRPGSPSNARLLPHPHLRITPLAMEEIAHLPKRVTEPCTYAVHLAWDPRRTDFAAQRASLSAALDFVEALGIIGCRRFLGIGSQAEYGATNAVMEEALAMQPATPYGAAKAAALHMTRLRAQQLGIDWIWGRVFSVYGRYEPETTLLSYLAHTLCSGGVPRMTAGTQRWDYLYAADAADAMAALLARGKAGEVYNIAHGDVRPLRAFAEEMRAILAPAQQIAYGTSDRPPASMHPSVEKIYADTGWRAAVSFAEGVQRTYHEK
ncbi:NAD-dependent epimerase/dehydratase family protein [Selenomonas noxia]